MPLKRYSMVSVSIIVGAAAVQASATAQQDQGFTEWAAPTNLGPPVNTAGEESAPAISDDGLSLYFNRNPNLPGDADEDLYVSHRSRPKQPPRRPLSEWGDPVPLVTVNTPTFHERNANLSRDGLLLFFSSDRLGGFGGLDLYVSRRSDRNDDQGWSTPVNLGPAVNSAAADVGPDYVEGEAGGTVLYFTSNRPAAAGFGAADIYASKLGADGSFGPATLVPELSSPSGDARPAIEQTDSNSYSTPTARARHSHVPPTARVRLAAKICGCRRAQRSLILGRAR